MITKEELERLIKEEEAVYYVGDEIKEIKLNWQKFSIGYVDLEWEVTTCLKQRLYTYFDENGDECEHNEYYLFEDLYKTKEEAEWVCETHAKQTITFSPCTWEDFISDKYNKRFVFIDKKLQPMPLYRHRY